MPSGAELHPVTSAKTIRVSNGKMLTTDGPFAETKEPLGGYLRILVNVNSDSART